MDIFNPLPPHERDEPIFTPAGGPPQTDRIPPAVYEAMGEAQITAFFHAFYQRLGKSAVADLFPKSEKNLMRAADKSAAMFTFLFGGPHLYQKQYGQPMMRARHLPFVITESARQEWLRCYKETLDEAPEKYNMPPEHVESVWNFVVDFSAWMVNAQDKGTEA
jgi:hemoglobin